MMNLYNLAYNGKSPDRGKTGIFDQIVKSFVDAGYPEHVAYGAMGSDYSESGLNPAINERNPVVPGSRGGFGMAQWTGPRRRQLEAFAKQQGARVDDPMLQHRFRLWELENTEARAGAALRNTSNEAEAARVYTGQYLRPGIDHTTRSVQMAQRLAGGYRPSNAFATRQMQEVADLQVEYRNQVEELNKFENDAAVLHANPAERQRMAAMQPYQPMGGPSIMGTDYLVGGINDDLDLGEPTTALTELPKPMPGDLSYRLGDTPYLGGAGYPSDPYTFSSREGDATTEQAASPLAPSYSPRPRQPTEAAYTEQEEPDRKWWQFTPEQIFAGLEALGIGFGQISADQPVNVTNAFQRRTENTLNRQELEQRKLNQDRTYKLGSAQEARLQQQYALDQQKIAQTQQGRAVLAQQYYEVTNDEAGAKSILHSPEAAMQAAQMLFKPPKGETTPGGFEEQQVSFYSDPGVREGVAAAAEAAGYDPTIVQQARENPYIAANVGKELAKRTAQQRNLAAADPEALLKQMQYRADTAPNDEMRQAYSNFAMSLEDAMIGGVGAETIEKVIKDYMEYQKVGSKHDASVARNQRAVAELFPVPPQNDADAKAQQFAKAAALAGEDFAMSDVVDYAETLYSREAEKIKNQNEAEATAILANTAKMFEENGAPNAASLMANGNATQAMEMYKIETGKDAPTEIRTLEILADRPDLMKTSLELAVAKAGAKSPGQEIAFEAAKKEMVAFADQLTTHQKHLEAAEIMMQTLAENPDVHMGGIRGALTEYAPYLASLGISLMGNQPVAEVLNSMMVNMARNERIQGEGAASNYDQQLYQQSSPRMKNTKLANMMLAQYKTARTDKLLWTYDKMKEWYATSDAPFDTKQRKQWIDEQAVAEHKDSAFMPTLTHGKVNYQERMSAIESARGKNILVRIDLGGGKYNYVITGRPGELYDAEGNKI